MKKGETTLPLHGGKAPRWLFKRMKKLARGISLVIVEEFGPEELLKRLSDPHWFQAFGCALGFDWHSSGLTTTVCGAMKEGLKGLEKDTGIHLCGGKGKQSLKTPDDIATYCQEKGNDPSDLIYASRMSAKVDNTAVQDGYQLYHHSFFFLEDDTWCVVQQGMNDDSGKARRYHWLSDSFETFTNEPQEAVCTEQSHQHVLNMVDQESEGAREASSELARRQEPEELMTELIKFELPDRHHITRADVATPRLKKNLTKAYEEQPEDYEDLLDTEGVGPKTIRALSLLGEIIYGEEPSFQDPARYSFAHGGKDGHPYPVNRSLYDSSIQFLEEMVNKADLDHSDKKQALKKLGHFKD